MGWWKGAGPVNFFWPRKDWVTFGFFVGYRFLSFLRQVFWIPPHDHRTPQATAPDLWVFCWGSLSFLDTLTSLRPA